LHTKEIQAVLRRLAEAEEPQLLLVGPSGAHLVPADVEVVGTYDERATETQIREDLAAAGEARAF
jgi:hypothetical protein